MIDKLKEELNITSKDSKILVEGILDLMSESIVEDSSLKIAEFGSFNIGISPKREIQNPLNGDTIQVEEKKRATFHAYSKIKDQLNSDTDEDFFSDDFI